jgi:hypothetical protein
MFGSEVFAHDSNDANIRKVAGSQGEESARPTEDIFHASRRRGNGIKGNRTYGKNAH